MKKNIFAVCDLEVDYAFNFMDYLNQKKNLPFEIQAFTTAESLIAYGKENHIELLLISDKAMRKEVRDLGIGRSSFFQRVCILRNWISIQVCININLPQM